MILTHPYIRQMAACNKIQNALTLYGVTVAEEVISSFSRLSQSNADTHTTVVLSTTYRKVLECS